MSKLGSSHFVKHFLPFIVIVAGSYVGLIQFRKINYEFKRHDASNIIFKDQLTRAGANADDYQAMTTQSLQEEYSDMMSKIDLEKWKNIRGPRPWEDSKQVQSTTKKE